MAAPNITYPPTAGTFATFGQAGAQSANAPTAGLPADQMTALIAAFSGTATAIAPFASTSVESSHIAKNSGGALYSAGAVVGQSSGFLLIMDSVGVPSPGSVLPKWSFPIGSNMVTGYYSERWPAPLLMSNGIVLLFSVATSPLIYTPATGLNQVIFMGQFL